MLLPLPVHVLVDVSPLGELDPSAHLVKVHETILILFVTLIILIFVSILAKIHVSVRFHYVTKPCYIRRMTVWLLKWVRTPQDKSGSGGPVRELGGDFSLEVFNPFLESDQMFLISCFWYHMVESRSVNRPLVIPCQFYLRSWPASPCSPPDSGFQTLQPHRGQERRRGRSPHHAHLQRHNDPI